MIPDDMFDEIYSSDLRYVTDCWKLCGDAHCCSFGRYKSRFRLLSKTIRQQLPLLPGEYEYLARKGWLAQFNDFEHAIALFPLKRGQLRIEHIVSRQLGCACDQALRPTVCRLYPLLPVYDVAGRLVATDAVGIYDDLESIDHLPRACRLMELPLSELGKFLKIVNAIGRSPLALFYVTAYQIAKSHVRARLRATRERWGGDVFGLFEEQFLTGELLAVDELTSQLDELVEQFDRHYGRGFLDA